MFNFRKQTFSFFLRSSIFISGDHLGGVLSELRNVSSSLSEYLNLFTVTAYATKNGAPQSVFNPDENFVWYTNNMANPWIQIEMHTALTITGYILMSYDAVPSYPRDWYLEGRNSASDAWQRIDERNGETELQGEKNVKSFTNNRLSTCTFKIFRLTLIADTNVGTNDPQLGLNEMDFISESQLPKRTKNNCATKSVSGNLPVIASFMITLFISGSFISNRIFIDTQLKSE